MKRSRRKPWKKPQRLLRKTGIKRTDKTLPDYKLRHRKQKGKAFNSADASISTDNFLVKDICRATSAAPTYFSPARIQSQYGQNFSLIDGGVYANNPALCAYAEARKMPFGQIFKTDQKPDYPTVNDMIIISIGTGSEAKSYPFKKMENAGKLAWIGYFNRHSSFCQRGNCRLSAFSDVSDIGKP